MRPADYPESFIKDNGDFWRKRLGKSLTDDEALNVAATVLSFFEELGKWEMAENNPNARSKRKSQVRLMPRPGS